MFKMWHWHRSILRPFKVRRIVFIPNRYCISLIVLINLIGCTVTPLQRDQSRCLEFPEDSAWAYDKPAGTVQPGVLGTMDRQFKAREGAAACEQVLVNPIPWKKQTRILRAKALHSIAAVEYSQALQDLDRIAALALENGDAETYAATLGHSVSQMRGMVLSLSGNDTEADAILQAEIEANPYNRWMQVWALGYMSPEYMGTPAYADLIAPMARLDPAYMSLRANMASWHEMYNDITANDLGALVMRSLADGDYSPSFDLTGVLAQPPADTNAKPDQVALVAFAAALAARPDEARDWLRTAYALHVNSRSSAQQLESIKVYESLIDAEMSLRANNSRAALDAVRHTTTLPLNGSVTQLLGKLQAAVAEREQRLFKMIDVADEKQKYMLNRSSRVRKNQNFSDYFKVLPDYHTVRSLNSYSGQIPFLKASGFDEVENDDGTVTIEYVGPGSTISAVEEMTLLRIAELAVMRGADAFLILDNQSLLRFEQRYSGTFKSGSPIARGYKTEIRVYFLDAPILPPALKYQESRIIKAADVLNALYEKYTGKQHGRN